MLKIYKLSDSISLFPGPRYEPHKDESVMRFDCTFFYVETNPPMEQIGPTTWPHIVSYKNLRDFVLFWAFLTREQGSIRAFEIGNGPMIRDTPPDEKPSFWDNNPTPLDPAMFPLENKFLSLDTGFTTFQNAGYLRDLAALFTHMPNRYVIDGRRIAYNNYLFNVSLIWFVIDALLPADKCGSAVKCPKCGQDACLTHPITNFQTRAEKALHGFKDAEKYAKLLNKLRSSRGTFVHNGTAKEYPDTFFPDADPVTGLRQREVLLQEMLEKMDSEGLATQSALINAGEITYWLLLNKLFPTLEIWPEIKQLKLWANG